MIHARKSQILDRLPADQVAGAAFGLGGVESALAHGLEQGPQGGYRVGRHGVVRRVLWFDSVRTASIEWRIVPRPEASSL